MNVYIYRDDEQFGPYSLAEVQAYLDAGNFAPIDSAWYEGGTEWTTISNIPGIVIPQILGQKVAYDIGKMSFIGRLSSDKYAIVVRKNSQFKSIADLQKATAPTKFVSLSPGMTQYVSSKISTSALGIKAQNVSGYRGIRGMLVALIRGDGDAAVTAVQTAIPFFESGDVVPLAFLSSPMGSVNRTSELSFIDFPELLF